jgi:hypothetical protein
VCTALMLGVPANLIYDGTFTESPILTAIGLGGIFFVANSKQHLLFTMMAAFFCTILQGAVLAFTSPLGLPALNLAFHITTWCFVLAGSASKHLTPVDIQQISVAEDHIRRVQLNHKITSKFKQLNQLANLLKVCTVEERYKLDVRMTPVLLCWFANVGDIPAIRELIQLGVELNMKDQYNGNRTALHLAASAGNTHVIRLLIENKVELVQDDRRETAF